MKKDLIYSGKAKDIYSTDHVDEIVAVYKDQVTALNGGRKEEARGKGRLNNLISSFIFDKLNQAGFQTHFIRTLSDEEQLNKRVTIIPLEVVLRNRVAGSFAKRFGLEEGAKLEKPIVEFYYKNDQLDDPFINDEHTAFLGLLDKGHLDYIKEETHRINRYLLDLFTQIGLDLVDFKLEFGFDSKGNIVLADEFSPDNCRLWDEEGNHLDKDVFRRDLGDLTLVYEQVLAALQSIN